MLSEVLKSIKGFDPEVICVDSRMRLSEILKRAQTLENNAPTVAALSIKDPIELVTHLVGLDGYTQTIVLVSPETSSDELHRRLKFFERYELITDHNTAQTNLTVDNAEAVPRTSGNCVTGWVVATSGTTRVPKQVVHTLRSLTRTTRVGNGSAYKWGVLYDPYRFAGLQVILQGLLGNSSIVFPDLQRTMQDQLAFLVEENVNALSATPTLWRKILMCEKSKALDLRTISLGGEIVDDAILRILCESFPNASIRHIYASTEAGAGLTVDDGCAGFPASYLSCPPDAIVLKVCNQTLHVKNLEVKAQYIGDSESFSDKDGFIDTGDQVVVKGDRVYFQGRLDGVINVGGNKVFPEHVESILYAVRNVSFARVYGQPNSIVGQLVVADIVVRDNTYIEKTRAQLKRKAGEELKSFERPTHYNFVAAMEHTLNGKVARI